MPNFVRYTDCMTRKLTFIHAADIHMGAPVRGFADLTPEWEAKLIESIPTAYDRVISAALSRNVDFVIIAGDMFDTAHASYGDYLRFIDGLTGSIRLEYPRTSLRVITTRSSYGANLSSFCRRRPISLAAKHLNSPCSNATARLFASSVLVVTTIKHGLSRSPLPTESIVTRQLKH